jgi:hypothetical protein
MSNKFYNYILAIFIVVVSSTAFSSCSKDTPGAQVELSYKMLSDKTWFLDYVQTINGSSIKTKTYLGQTTYFVNFLKDYTTLDSDGIAGTYDIEVVNGKILVKVNAKTAGGNTVVYDYVVESMGAKVLVMSYNSNGVVNKFYYSAK